MFLFIGAVMTRQFVKHLATVSGVYRLAFVWAPIRCPTPHCSSQTYGAQSGKDRNVSEEFALQYTVVADLEGRYRALIYSYERKSATVPFRGSILAYAASSAATAFSPPRTAWV